MLARGITIEEIADIVFDLQRKYNPNLSKATCVDAVNAVLEKRGTICRINRLGFR